jgi:O-antigen ligase
MWKFAFNVANEHPVLGFGQQALKERKLEAVRSGDFDPIISQYAHIHNEIMDIYLENGLVGLSGFIFLFGCLFMIFYQHRFNEDVQVRALAMAGILFLLLFLEFGLSNPQFSFNAPRNIFCGWAVVIAGLLHNRCIVVKTGPEKILKK